MRRILFVDDEPQVLQGIQRMLHRQRGIWEMRFVGDAADALAALDAERFDVLVADLRMPRMDGAALLAAVRERFPGVVRVVLSGHTDLEATLRAIPVAHLFLGKPCPPAVLLEAVARACDLQTVLADEALRQSISSMSSLPSVPRLFAAISGVLADPTASVGAVARVLEGDVGVCAKVLRLANSGFFGLPSRVTDVDGAIRLVGMTMLRNLVLAVEVFDAVEAHSAPAGVSLAAMQHHAVVTGSIARRLVPDRRQGENAFLAGMLHDVGVLVLASQRPDTLGRAMALSRDVGQPLHVAELGAGGVTHAEIGSYLLSLWNLPCPIIEVVAHHHAPGRVQAGGFDLVGAVHVADALAHEVAGRGTGTQPPLDVAYLDSMGVTDRIEEWRGLAAEQADALPR